MANILDYIDKMQEMYEGKPSSTVQESRPMFANGQLVQPNADGSRPGYAGNAVEANIRLTPTGNAYEVAIQRGPQIFNKTFRKDKYKNATEALNAARKFRDQKKKIPFKTGIQEPTYGSGLSQKEYMKIYNEANRDLTESGKLAQERDLKLKNFIGKKKKIKSSVLRDFILNDIGYVNYDATKIKKKFPNLVIEKDIKTGSEYKPLTKEEIIKVKDNFDLPEGEKWDFKKYKNGLSGEKYPNLVNQIRSRVADPKNYKIAANFSDPQGWMMSSMNRVYENELKNKVKPKDRTYQPKFNNRGIIVGFTDNTATGQGRTFYGLKKNMREDGTEWRAHGDFGKVDKFIDIANGVKENPNKVLQKILNDKGLNNIKGLTLNDVLSHQRYYSKLSETAPQELLKRQIVLHHTKGVGAGDDVARAAATKDIQLLTAANNSRANALEQIVRGTKKNPARKLNAKEILELKNIGAKITDLDGKVVGGGSLVAEKQYAAIEKNALKYAKGDKFNIKTVASYLERLGCGQAAGGRILMSNGGATLTKCAKKGQQKLNLGLTNGFSNKTEGELAKRILQAGRGMGSMFALRNILGPAAIGFTVAAEAGLVGYDMLSQGKSFREAVGDSLFNYALGDKTKIDPAEERYKRYDKQGFDVDKIRNYEKTVDRINEIGSQYDDLYRKIDAVNIGGPRISDAIKQKQQIISDKAKSELPAFSQDLYRTGEIPRLEKFIENDFIKGAQEISEADRLSEIDRLSNINQYAIGRNRALEDQEKIRQLKLQDPNVRSYMGDRPITYGFARGGLSGGDTSGRPPESGPMSQGLRSLYKNGRKL